MESIIYIVHKICTLRLQKRDKKEKPSDGCPRRTDKEAIALLKLYETALQS